MRYTGGINIERQHGESQTAFAGRVLKVRVDPVWAKSGLTTREVVERPVAAAIIAESPDQRLVVVRQYRWAVADWLFELPAGLVEEGEDPLAAAKRELAEETGWTAQHWQTVYQFFPSPGYSTEVIHLFFASGLCPGTPHGDPDEELEVSLWTAARAEEARRGGEITNGIMLLGVGWWLTHQGRV